MSGQYSSKLGLSGAEVFSVTFRPSAAETTSETAEEALLHLSGAQASEAAFKASAPGRRILHLATHGFFLGDDCAASSGSRGLKIVAEPEPRVDPATRSFGCWVAGPSKTADIEQVVVIGAHGARSLVVFVVG